MDVDSFRAVFENLASPMAMATPDGQMIEANEAYCRFLGYSKSELLSKSVFDITHPDDVHRAKRLFAEVAEGKRNTFHYEKRYLRKDGREVWAVVTTSWIGRPGTGSPFCFATIQDITARKMAEIALKEREEIYRSLVENIDLGIALIDEHHVILTLNRALARMFHKDPRELKEKSCFRTFVQGGKKCRVCPGARAMKEARPQILETEGVRDDGSRFMASIRAFPVFDPDGKARKFIEVVEDVTQKRAIESELKENQDRVNYLAHHDPLTDLPNRLLLYDRLKHAIDRSQRQKEGLAVLVFDLDRFKKINKILGFEVGNQVLREVGSRLKAHLRRVDSLCHLGGNEFAMVLEKAGALQQSAKVARIILSTLNSRPFDVAGHELRITASVGISHYPGDGDDVETLLKAAESARIMARDRGGDGYRYYQSDMERNSKYLLELEGQLHKALAEDQLTAYYQAQVDPSSGRIIGVEALARWRHPERGLVSPADFIPLAEETGLIVPLGRRVLDVACRQAREWLEAGLLDFRVAVNISALQIAKGHLAQTIKDVLKTTGLPPAFLEIEITETALMSEPEIALRTLDALKKMEIRIALDDFGTGYSALSYLKNFPIDRIKIAQSFIRNVPHNPHDTAIVKSIFALGKSLGIGVIAEGVETADHLTFLFGLGCTEVQGYYFARPTDGASMTKHIQEWFGPNGVCPLKG